ncbi:MAG: formate dehydrogenase accessory sulfurtransferase FdhD [Bacillota bacterium]
MTDFFVEKEILRFENNKFVKTRDYIVKEEFYKLIVDGEYFYDIAASPVYVEDMALGRAYCEGLIANIEEVAEINFIKDKNLIKIITKTDFEKKDYSFKEDNSYFLNNKVKASLIFKIIDDLSEKSEIFKKTGGVHNALLANEKGEIMAFREDIARHNTVDKIAAYILKNEIDISNKILALSCRISTKIINKVSKIGLTFIITQSPPSYNAVKIAEEKRITIAGFVRENRMNVYTHSEKLEK